MKQKKNVADTVRDIAEPLAESFGYVLWDVEYVREGADMILRITIDSDKEGGIDINDCEKMHRAIDPLLDEADPIEGAYMLAVSSPNPIFKNFHANWTGNAGCRFALVSVNGIV